MFMFGTYRWNTDQREKLFDETVFVGIDAEVWIRQQTRYDMQMAKSDKSFLERLANIRKMVAVL